MTSAKVKRVMASSFPMVKEQILQWQKAVEAIDAEVKVLQKKREGISRLIDQLRAVGNEALSPSKAGTVRKKGKRLNLNLVVNFLKKRKEAATVKELHRFLMDQGYLVQERSVKQFLVRAEKAGAPIIGDLATKEKWKARIKIKVAPPKPEEEKK